TAESKSPPAVVHDCVLKNVNVQVASPAVAWMPSPSPLPVPPVPAFDVPSPQACCTRCRAIVCAPFLVLDMFNVSVTLLTVDPAGTVDRSNRINPRRTLFDPCC